MIKKTEVTQIKERGLTETFYLSSGKGNLKGFQANFETFFFNTYQLKSDNCQLERKGEELKRIQTFR